MSNCHSSVSGLFNVLFVHISESTSERVQRSRNGARLISAAKLGIPLNEQSDTASWVSSKNRYDRESNKDSRETFRLFRLVFSINLRIGASNRSKACSSVKNNLPRTSMYKAARIAPASTDRPNAPSVEVSPTGRKALNGIQPDKKRFNFNLRLCYARLSNSEKANSIAETNREPFEQWSSFYRRLYGDGSACSLRVHSGKARLKKTDRCTL